MNPIAIYSGGLVIYWSAMVIALGIAAGFFLSLSLHISDGGRASAMWVFLPIATVLSVFFSRLMHWYCHLEQYGGFIAAMTDYSVGAFCLAGVLLGVSLAAWIVKLMGLCDNRGELLDAAAPGLSLTIAFVRLSALFNSSCRSKIIINSKLLQRLPIGSELTSASGVVEYRFATFFVQFILMMIVTILLIRFWARRRNYPMKGNEPEYGHVSRMFLVLYAVPEVVFDSTRYDSSFFHFTFIKYLNRYMGFVSFTQIISGFIVLAIIIHYSRASIRANGFKWYHIALWVTFVLTLVGVGVSEYMVQRHGDWYLGCYGAMSLSCAVMILTVWLLYLSCCDRDAAEELEEFD